MTLGFQHRFVDKILNGSKIHTVRVDKTSRWKIGNKIHFCTDIRTKNRNQFMFGKCTNVKEIEINGLTGTIIIDGIKLNDDQINQFMLNDGFDSKVDFWSWKGWNDQIFNGKIIYWT